MFQFGILYRAVFWSTARWTLYISVDSLFKRGNGSFTVKKYVLKNGVGDSLQKKKCFPPKIKYQMRIYVWLKKQRIHYNIYQSNCPYSDIRHANVSL